MAPMTSPNDPVFFLHHCFIDKVWADWQALQMENNPDTAPHYAPIQGWAEGHNIADKLKPWKRTIREVLDIAKLGYSYEQTKVQAKMLKKVAETTPKSPFMHGGGSPFWAD